MLYLILESVDIALICVGGNDALNEGSSSIPDALENISSNRLGITTIPTIRKF